MRGADAEHVHQRNRILGHVAELVGRRNRNFQEAQLQQLQRGQPLAAGEFGGLADIAVVETDDTKAARGQPLAKGVVPEHHLGAEPHDQQHRLCRRLAENLVTNVDAVGAGDLRRLVGDGGQWGFSLSLFGNSIA